MSTSKLILFAGASGSGKSTLASLLASHLDAVVVGLDDYYRDRPDIELSKRAELNYDHPSAIEFELLEEHLALLHEGRSIEKPVYDFAAHRRSENQTQRISPAPCIIVEGIFTLCSEKLRERATLTVFVDTPIEVCFERRLFRDIRERGRTEDSVRQQWKATVLPGYYEHCLPHKQHADMILFEEEATPEQYIEKILGRLETS